MADPKSRHAELAKVVNAANHEYHVSGNSSLTDSEYDSFVREMRQIEEDHPELAKGSPTGQVGASSPGAKVKHVRPMLSLDNVFTPQELRKFFKTSYEIVWEPKIDGLSLSLQYSNGHLVRGVTRGDGREGDDVTHNVLVIPSIPKVIPFKESLEVRGEVYIREDDFAQIVKEMEEEGDEPFANARNAAAGSLKLKDSNEAKKRKLNFAAYHAFGLPAAPQVGLPITGQTMVCVTLRSFGFDTTVPCMVDIKQLDQAMMDEINDMRTRFPYATDGVVFKIENLKIREELGLGTKSPKWAVAYKFPPEEGVTTLKEVMLQVGRTGTINPVAIMAPVQLNGATVTRASLCNYEEITRLDIAVGDEVVVVRAAEVIPKVIRVHKKSATRVQITPPATCPVCGAVTFKDPELVAYVCSNKLGCKAQATERIVHAVSKSCLDWDGFGIAQVEDFISRGLTTLSAIIATQDLAWMKPAAKKKFLTERERVKASPLWRKLHALGLEKIGKSFCQDLAFKYGSILKIADDYDGVVALVGPNRAAKMFKQLEDLIPEIEALDQLGFTFEEQKRQTPTTQATGKTFVITGVLVTGTREAVSAKIEQAGGVVKTSVGKTTNYLIVGNDAGANKTNAAAKHGTKILSEEELYALLGLDFEVASSPLDGVNMDEL